MAVALALSGDGDSVVANKTARPQNHALVPRAAPTEFARPIEPICLARLGANSVCALDHGTVAEVTKFALGL